ncbi:MAG: peptide MFS transporter [Pseudomonadota bacterium]
MDASVAQGKPIQNTIFGHPRGLVICFFTEMWERFSYYGMRALLIFYLTQHFLFEQSQASLIYGTYISLVYITPVIGGYVADRYLGSRKAVTLGAVLLVLGHMGMALEGEGSKEFLTINGTEYEVINEGRADSRVSYLKVGEERAKLTPSDDGFAVDTDINGIPALLKPGMLERRVETDQTILSLFYLSLALIIAGVGFLKANISTIVGALYEPGDSRRDAGFTIFYMGINLGSFLAVIACGYLGEVYGWAYGFGLAGLGMIAGLIVFLLGQPWLEGRADPPNASALKAKGFLFLNTEWTLYVSSLLVVAGAFVLMQFRQVVEFVQYGSVAAFFGFMMWYSITKCTKDERDRMLVALFLTLCQLPFWALFEQTGSSLNLFTRDAVDRTIFGNEVPASLFLSLNAFFIFTLAPLFAIGWVWLSRRGWEPSTPAKFGFALVQVGLGFLVLVLGIEAGGAGVKVALIWVVLIYLLHTTGELCLSPVGLSMITKLSVGHVVGAMMGGWMLAQALAGFLSGQIAAATGAETIGGQITNLAAAKAGYADVYSQIGWVSVACGGVLLVLSPMLKKRMHGIH